VWCDGVGWGGVGCAALRCAALRCALPCCDSCFCLFLVVEGAPGVDLAVCLQQTPTPPIEPTPRKPPHNRPKRIIPNVQVLALKSLRSFSEDDGSLPDAARDYNPSNPEVIDLLSRWVGVGVGDGVGAVGKGVGAVRKRGGFGAVGEGVGAVAVAVAGEGEAGEEACAVQLLGVSELQKWC